MASRVEGSGVGLVEQFSVLSIQNSTHMQMLDKCLNRFSRGSTELIIKEIIEIATAHKQVLSGEELLLLLSCIMILSSSCYDGLDLFMNALCELSCPFFSMGELPQYKSLYGEISWIQSLTCVLEKSDDAERAITFCQSVIKTILSNAKPATPCLEPITSTSHWNALCNHLAKLFPLFSQADFKNAFLRWVEKSPLDDIRMPATVVSLFPTKSQTDYDDLYTFVQFCALEPTSTRANTRANRAMLSLLETLPSQSEQIGSDFCSALSSANFDTICAFMFNLRKATFVLSDVKLFFGFITSYCQNNLVASEDGAKGEDGAKRIARLLALFFENTKWRLGCSRELFSAKCIKGGLITDHIIELLDELFAGFQPLEVCFVSPQILKDSISFFFIQAVISEIVALVKESKNPKRKLSSPRHARNPNGILNLKKILVDSALLILPMIQDKNLKWQAFAHMSFLTDESTRLTPREDENVVIDETTKTISSPPLS